MGVFRRGWCWFGDGSRSGAGGLARARRGGLARLRLRGRVLGVAGVTYPITSCRLMESYSVRTLVNPASSKAVSVMVTGRGHSVLMWPKNDSIQA